MKIRKATENDEGPYLAGLVVCDHVTVDNYFGPGDAKIKHSAYNCPICHGTGFRTFPVVIVPDNEDNS